MDLSKLIREFIYSFFNLIALILPFIFVYSAPEKWKDFIFHPGNVPDQLNPWAGWLFLFILSFLFVRIGENLFHLLIERHRKNNEPKDWMGS